MQRRRNRKFQPDILAGLDQSAFSCAVSADKELERFLIKEENKSVQLNHVRACYTGEDIVKTKIMDEKPEYNDGRLEILSTGANNFLQMNILNG